MSVGFQTNVSLLPNYHTQQFLLGPENGKEPHKVQQELTVGEQSVTRYVIGPLTSSE